MALGVNGYLELYTTLLGWQQYQNLWDIAVKTGLAFIPFAVLIVRNLIEPAISQEARSASGTSLKRMEYGLPGMLLVIMVCCQPVIPLEPSALSYTPVCQAQGHTARPGDTGTTYDTAFPQATGATVPALWYAVMAISHAITRAAILGLPCQPINYRELHNTLALSKIQDPALRQETGDFYRQCYLQALAKFDREKPDTSAYTQKTGDADTQWMGSQTFINMPGFYDYFSAGSAVQGFPYDPQRDFEYGQNHGQWGKPTCKDWWLGTTGQNGLRGQLLQSLPKPLFSFLETQSDEQDGALKGLIHQTYDAGYQSLNDEDSGHWISKNLGQPIGVQMEDLSYYPKLALIKSALPVIQALCLMLIYIFLALAQPFTKYSIKAITIAAFVIFSVTFWTFIWYVTDYVDQSLIQALFPSLIGIDSGNGTQQDLVDMVVSMGYTVAPLLWTLFLSWLGVQAGSGITSAISGGLSPAQEAGGQAGNIGKQVVNTVATRGMRAEGNFNPNQRRFKF